MWLCVLLWKYQETSHDVVTLLFHQILGINSLAYYNIDNRLGFKYFLLYEFFRQNFYIALIILDNGIAKYFSQL